MAYVMLYIATSAAFLMFAGYFCQKLAELRDIKRFPPPGEMIDVGGHKLHLIRSGAGRPVVVIEQGAGAPSLFWWNIRNRIAEFTEVVLYDRGGLGWSDPAQLPRTMEDRVADLHALLVNAHLLGPYILVAHSYGGWIVRLFAREHPDEVAGLVLVDTGEENVYSQPEVVSTYSRFRAMARMMGYGAKLGILRIIRPAFLRPGPDLQPTVREAAASIAIRPHSFFAAADDLESFLERVQSWRLGTDKFGSLGDLPLTVITHGQPFPGPFSVVEKYWADGQKRLATLSTNAELIKAAKSSHMIFHDEPDLVIAAIRRMVTAARAKTLSTPGSR